MQATILEVWDWPVGPHRQGLSYLYQVTETDNPDLRIGSRNTFNTLKGFHPETYFKIGRDAVIDFVTGEECEL